MGQLFKGQIGLKIIATVGQDVAGASCKIKYKDPDGTAGEFAADIVTEATGEIQYITTAATDIGKKGNWTFWGHVTFAGGSIAAGEPYQQYIYDEGQVEN